MWLLPSEAIRGHWIQGAMARDARRQVVVPDDPNAVGWCSLGILMRVASSVPMARILIHIATGYTKSSQLAGWNDRIIRSEEDVIEVLRKTELCCFGPCPKANVDGGGI